MAQLFFRYGTMNAGKSIELIKVAHNYEERGKRALLLTSAKDDRHGRDVVQSRIGVSKKAISVEENTNLLNVFMIENMKQIIDCVLVDEAQFLLQHHVEELVEIVDSLDCPVICYGLKNDFRNQLFEGSMHLLIQADKIEEIKTICWCGRKATMTARVEDGRILRTGEQVVIGGNDSYVSLCRKHYYDGRLGPDEAESLLPEDPDWDAGIDPGRKDRPESKTNPDQMQESMETPTADK